MEWHGPTAQKAVDFFHECLTHQEGDVALTPFILEPWQQAIIGNLYGWKKTTGKRRYREAMVFIPRKNGKTTLAAGIVLYSLFCDGEYGAQVYSAAGDRDQAALVFRQARGMVQSHPALKKRGQPFKNSIVFAERNSSYKVISKDATTAHGQNPHCIIIDELHVQKTRDLVDTLTSGAGNREQPIIVSITTAGFDRASICYEKYQYACKIRDGVLQNPSCLPVIYEATANDNWTAESTWRKSNPNIGVSVKLSFLQEECKKAQDIPAYENTFRRLHLNQWTEQETRAIQMDEWDKCGEDYTEDDLLGRECWGGLDLGNTMDTTAAVFVFPESDGRVRLLPYIWIPEDIAKKRERVNRQNFLAWRSSGFVRTTPGNQTDYSAVRESLLELRDKFKIRAIAYDQHNATTLSQWLVEDGFELEIFRQRIQDFNEPTKLLLALIASGKLIHPRNAALTWMASNVAIRTDCNENMRPDKAKSSDKIDGIVAGIMALGRMIVAPLEQGSVYDTPGSLAL